MFDHFELADNAEHQRNCHIKVRRTSCFYFGSCYSWAVAEAALQFGPNSWGTVGNFCTLGANLEQFGAQRTYVLMLFWILFSFSAEWEGGRVAEAGLQNMIPRRHNFIIEMNCYQWNWQSLMLNRQKMVLTITWLKFWSALLKLTWFWGWLFCCDFLGQFFKLFNVIYSCFSSSP